MNAPAKIEDTTPAIPNVSMTPMEMISQAVESGAGVEMIERLMTLQERWEANMGRKAFDLAISEAKAKIPAIVKNREVDFTSSKGRTHYRHEDLAQIAKVIDPILAEHGLSYRYRSEQDGQTVKVTCILSHRDGYSEETSLQSGSDQSGNKNHIQAVGSALTYLQRYTLKAALGLAASNDDDGQQAETGARITADQFRTLQEKIERAGADEERFVKYLKVESLEELPQSKFGAADAALDQKIANKESGNA